MIDEICKHCNQFITFEFINDQTKDCKHDQNVLNCLVCTYHENGLKKIIL